MNEQELKPCPYCGSTDIKLHDEITHAVWCQECFAEVESIDIESAVELWNKRPIEDALQARIVELEDTNRFEEKLYTQRLLIENYVKCEREYELRIAELEAQLAEALPYLINEKIRKGQFEEVN